MNNVSLTGRLTREPELRYGGQDNSTAITRFTLTYIAANNRNGGYEHCNHADRKYTVADYSSITAAYGAGTGAGSSAARTD